jgi:SH3-like domain-containing protein
METVPIKRSIIAGICILLLVGAAGVGAFLFMRQNATASGDVEITGSTTNIARAAGPSGLPIPRYVSLKTDRVNVRRGPSTAHQVIWVFARKGLPVEIIAEYEHWRRVRDSEGEEGWVYHSLLAGRRTGLVAPWRDIERLPLLDSPEDTADTVAMVETGVVGNIDSCSGQWCEFSVNGLSGWIEQELLWGVYPDETIN